MKNLIVLSGNIATGKTTLGEILGKELDLTWIPESSISDLFPKIYKSTERDYKLLSFIIKATHMAGVVNDRFNNGEETIIIEGFVLDNLIRFNRLMDLFNIREQYKFYEKLNLILGKISVDINIHYYILTNDVNVLYQRVLEREGYDQNIYSREIVDLIQSDYDLAIGIYKNSTKIFLENLTIEESIKKLKNEILSTINSLKVVQNNELE